jgi:ubiquinone/menaquinone biosynthesis C-methylase UbiE
MFPNIEFIEGDVEQLPFADGSFDGVLISGLVHHSVQTSHFRRFSYLSMSEKI